MRRIGRFVPWRWFALLAVLVAGGCSFVSVTNPAGSLCDDTISSARAVDGLYILPDDGRAPIIDELDAARCTIDVTIYLISDEEVIDALARAVVRGVKVRVLVEETPFGGFGQVDTADQLRQLGIQVKHGRDEFTFTHAKYLVVDGKVGIITNQNLTAASFDGNREFGVITTDPSVVESLDAVFDADWNRTEAPPVADRLIVSPINARARIEDLIARADTTIVLYVEVIRDGGIISALQDAAGRGVDVRLIVNAPDDELDLEALDSLASAGVRIRVAGHLYIHAKALMIDDRVVVIGSQNPTETSLDRNREVSLVVTDDVALARVRATVALDWMLGAPWLLPDTSMPSEDKN